MWSQEDAELYDQWYASPRGAFVLSRQRRLLQHVMSRWPRRGCSLLDVGCGTGLLSEFLWQGGFDLSCLDQSPAMLERAHARLGHRAAFHTGTAEHLPFDDRAFDYVSLLNVPEHLKDPHAALTEALRVAARGVVLGFLNACSLARIAQSCPGADPLPLPNGPRWLGLKTLCVLARSASGAGRLSFGSVLLGPPSTWKTGGARDFVNNLRLPLPLGAYAALSVMHGPGLTLTPLPLRIGKAGLKQASPHALMKDVAPGLSRTPEKEKS